MSAGKIFYYLNAALIVGFALGSFLYPVPWWAISIGICVTAVLVAYKTKSKIWLACGAVAFFGIAFVSFALFTAQHKHAAVVALSPQEFSGVVRDMTRQKSKLLVRLTGKSGTIRFTTYDVSIQEGEQLRVRCDAFSSSFSLNAYATSRQLGFCSDVIVLEQKAGSISFLTTIRRDLDDIISRALPSPESDLLSGMLLGKPSDFSSDLASTLQHTGTTHIVVLSGFNITIFAFVVSAVFRRFGIGLRASTIASLTVVSLFVCLVGFSAPVVRATLLVFFVLLARARGRPYQSLGLLLLSANVMLLQNPMLLRWSLSFQLSFFATFGVMHQHLLSRPFRFLPQSFGLRETVQTTAAATLMSVPLIAYAFGGISTVTLIANALVLPLVPFVMLAGLPVVLLGLFSQMGALIVGAIPFVALRFMTDVLTFFSDLPFSYIEGLQIPGWAVALWYAGVGVLVFRSRQAKKTHEEARSVRLHFSVSLIGTIAVVIFSVFALRSGTAKTPVLHFFDVGQGDSIHFRLPNGTDVLVDGGPDSTVLSRLGRSMPYTDRKIEIIALTHPHADHVAGLIDVIKKYDVGEFWFTQVAYDSPVYAELLKELKEKRIPMRVMLDGSGVRIPGNFSTDISVLAPKNSQPDSDLNQTSMVLRIEMAGKAALLMGDAGIPVESSLIQEYGSLLRADVLKAGHHGSSDASSQGFIQAVNPQLAIISVGEDNAYGQPAESTLQHFADARVPVFRTDQNGSITVTFTPDNPIKIYTSIPLTK